MSDSNRTNLKLSSQQKADAWRIAAMHLRSVCSNKENQYYDDDNEKHWLYIDQFIIPCLINQASKLSNDR
jgi:hypothetical protein